MKGKSLLLVTVLAAVVMTVGGVAVASLYSGGRGGSGCAEGATRTGVLSQARTAEAEGLAFRNEGEESRVRTENCLEAMNGECAGQCECDRERLRERSEDGSCEGECPGPQGECLMHPNGSPTGTGGTGGGGAGFSEAGRKGSENGGNGDCCMEQDRLRARDRDCSS